MLNLRRWTLRNGPGLILSLFASISFAQPAPTDRPPSPSGAVPSAAQLRWHELEFYGFLHFTVNTFTDKEWGYGDEPEQIFNPTALDARQWAQVAHDAGMKGLIITAKHHDGFCLWPSRYTEHSVKNSPWKQGRGDVLRELSAACREFGLKFGVYLSPWDRNRADYATPDYLTYYRNQLRELLTNYGPTFEVWFDGANGGDGFYGGAREKRRIDNSTYYDWENTWQIVRQLQPQAVMFSDAGPDVRWVGNERGVAFENSWMTLDRRLIYPGYPEYRRYAPGQPNGTDWVPPEVDVSIRPGWFYHASEDSKAKTAAQLVEIYYQSVGRSANLLLNIPPDRRGLIPENDARQLREFRRILNATFRTDLARAARATAFSTRGPKFSAAHVNDGLADSYWAAPDGVTTNSLTLEWKEPQTCDRVVLQEFIPLGQSIMQWALEAEQRGGNWGEIGAGQTIGYKRIIRFEPITTSRIRLVIKGAKATPTLRSFEAYLSPRGRGEGRERRTFSGFNVRRVASEHSFLNPLAPPKSRGEEEEPRLIQW